MHQLNDARSITSFDDWPSASRLTALTFCLASARRRRRLFGAFRLRLLHEALALRGLGRLRPAGEDLGDPHQGEFLPVTALAARVLAPALLEGDDLWPAPLVQDFR